MIISIEWLRGSWATTVFDIIQSHIELKRKSIVEKWLIAVSKKKSNEELMKIKFYNDDIIRWFYFHSLTNNTEFLKTRSFIYHNKIPNVDPSVADTLYVNSVINSIYKDRGSDIVEEDTPEPVYICDLGMCTAEISQSFISPDVVIYVSSDWLPIWLKRPRWRQKKSIPDLFEENKEKDKKYVSHHNKQALWMSYVINNNWSFALLKKNSIAVIESIMNDFYENL